MQKWEYLTKSRFLSGNSTAAKTAPFAAEN